MSSSLFSLFFSFSFCSTMNLIRHSYRAKHALSNPLILNSKIVFKKIKRGIYLIFQICIFRNMLNFFLVFFFFLRVKFNIIRKRKMCFIESERIWVYIWPNSTITEAPYTPILSDKLDKKSVKNEDGNFTAAVFLNFSLMRVRVIVVY